MMNGIKVTYYRKILDIGDTEIEFADEIKKVEVLDKKIIVLLSIPWNDDKTIDNIYALSFGGEVLWRVESLSELYPGQINLPYENMTVQEGEIRATDFYGRRYFIDIETGRIKKRDIVK